MHKKADGTGTTLFQVALPIGISFYTFQALSYVIDVYRGEVKTMCISFIFQTGSGACLSVNAQYYNIKDPPHTSILKKFTFWYEKGLRF